MESVAGRCEAPDGTAEEAAGHIATASHCVTSSVQGVGTTLTSKAAAQPPALKLPPTVDWPPLAPLGAPRPPAEAGPVEQHDRSEDKDDPGAVEDDEARRPALQA